MSLSRSMARHQINQLINQRSNQLHFYGRIMSLSRSFGRTLNLMRGIYQLERGAATLIQVDTEADEPAYRSERWLCQPVPHAPPPAASPTYLATYLIVRCIGGSRR